MWFGDYTEDFTTVTCMFTTHASTGAPVAPLTAFEAADVLIYKNGNAAQKTTTNGVTMTSPFDSITGLHCLVIDTSNDTGDAAFWVAGNVYTLVLSPDTETVDGVVVAKVIGQFGIELAGALRPTTASRKLDVSATGEAGLDFDNIKDATGAHTLTNITVPVVSAVTGLTASNLDATVSSRLASGSYTAPSNLTAAQIATGVWQDTTAGDFTVSASIGKSIMNGVALGTGMTVNDITTKTGFSLSQSFPSNFSSLAITAGGAMTAGTVSDKTGYALTQSFPSNFSSLAITALGKVTVGTNDDKTGYTVSTVSDKTGYALTSAYDPAKTAATQTSVDDLPTNSELTAALAGADDATLTAIAGLNNISASDVWSVPLPGAFSFGSAGQIVGDNVNAPISSRATAGQVWEEAIADHKDTVGSTAESLFQVHERTDAYLVSSTGTLATSSDMTAVKSVTDRLNGLLEDVSGDRFTAHALEQAPSGGGSAPTAGEIADAVWDEIIDDHSVTNSGGQYMQAIISNLGNISSALEDVPSDISNIKSVTDGLPTFVHTGGKLWVLNEDGNPLASASSVAALNDLSAADVNAEVDAALADYDGPTHAEMTAELASADDATLAAIGSISIPTASDTADEIETRTIKANIKYVNDIAIAGDGDAVIWGPA